MAQYTHKCLTVIFGAILASSFIGCASAPESGGASASNATATQDSAQASMNTTAETAAVAVATEPAKDFAGKTIEEPEPAAVSDQLENVPDMVESIRVVDSCKKEPYLGYENAARESIKKGWEATKAEKYGVGFRDAAEYKKWSNTHNTVFKRVSAACELLARCAKENAKDKKDKCADQAEKFRDWQTIAHTFAKRVAEVEHAQVEKLCSLSPTLDDPSRCFEQLAENVKKACDSEVCQELSQCWKNIYFMDGAIRQAESSCRFARQKLDKCRGYSEQIGRRKAQLERCSDMQQKINIQVMPVL